MSPTATAPHLDKPSTKSSSSKAPSTARIIEPRPSPPPKSPATPALHDAAKLSPAPATKPPAPTLSPAASAPSPATHADVLALHSAYGNAAMARAATSGALTPAGKSATEAYSGSAPAHAPSPSATTHAAPESPVAHTSASPYPSAAAPAKTPDKAQDKLDHAKPAPAETTAAKPETSHPAAHALAAVTSKPGAAATKSTAPSHHAAKHAEPSKDAAHKGSAHGAGAHAKTSKAAAHAAVAPVIHAIQHRAVTATKHSPADKPVASADAAGKNPATEQTRGAAVQGVSNLAAAKTAPVKRDDFKAKLKDAIAKATPEPKTEAQADEVKQQGGAKASGMLREQMNTQRDEAAGSLKSAASPEADVPASSQPAPPQENLTPEPIGAPPAAVAAGPAVPAALPAERLDYSSDRDATDQAMAESGVSKDQLEKGNEPEFNKTLSSRSDAEKREAAAPAKYRQSESNVRAKAEQTAHAEISGGLHGIHGARAQQIAKVVGQQVTTAAKHAAERQQVTDKINSIKNDTRKEVESILTSMETEATAMFEAGLAIAEKAYQDTFEEEKGGVGTWLTTWGDDWKELIENSLKKARQRYLYEVDRAIDVVAALVDGKIEAAKKRVEKGRQDVEDFVKTLHGNLAKFGADALKSVQSDFDQMSGDIDSRRDALVNKITDEYKASYDRMSAMEEKLREENKSLWDRIYDATVGLIKKILAFKDMLLNVLARAADAIGTIIAHPINFLGNLIDAGKLGFNNFVDHILEHLKAGFMEWLFGAVASTGIQLPKDFDLPGILSLVLQILGLTYSNIRSRAVKILGEKVVKALETAAEVFKILITKGPAGLWEYIKEKIGDLKSMVIEKIKAFVMEKIIMAGITWVIGLLNPASAFFKACKAIYDIVMFFIEHGQQILDLVNAIIDSITSIAKGAIGAAANFVEASLARTIPVIIGFLASLLGVGGISEKIKEIIESIRKPINEAIDWVINKAVSLVKAVGNLLGFGKDKADDKGEGKKPEGAIDVPLAMDGASHELIVVPGPEPTVLLASSEAKSISQKIAKAVEKLKAMGGSKKDQIESLQTIQGKQLHLLELLKEKREEEAKTFAQGLAAEIIVYATKYRVKDLEEIGDLYPAPAVGSYKEMTSVASTEIPPDGKTRTAHHVPPVQLARSLAKGMRDASALLAGDQDQAAAIIQGDARLLEDAAGTGHGGPLPTILIHPDTHKGASGQEGAHSAGIGEKIIRKLRESGVFVPLAAARKDTGFPAVNPQGKTYRAISAALTQQTQVATGTVVKEAFAADKERAVLIMKQALDGSKKDGPAEDKDRAISNLEEMIQGEWEDKAMGNTFEK